MGQTETLQLDDFGTFERVPGSQNQLFLFSETPGYFKKSQEIRMYFKNICFWKLQNLEIRNLDNFAEDGRRQIPTIRFIKCWEDLTWDQYLSKKHKMIFCGNTGSLNLWNFEIFKPRNQETLRPRNQETLRPRNFATKKPRSVETKIARIFETKKPKKPRNQEPPLPLNTDSHPHTRPPSLGTRANLGDTSGRRRNEEPKKPRNQQTKKPRN